MELMGAASKSPFLIHASVLRFNNMTLPRRPLSTSQPNRSLFTRRQTSDREAKTLAAKTDAGL